MEHEIFENGPIRITRTLRGHSFVYTITLEDFSQMVLNHRAFTDLKELMVAFDEDDIDALRTAERLLQGQLDFEIQEGEYG